MIKVKFNKLYQKHLLKTNHNLIMLQLICSELIKITIKQLHMIN
jgi:hypothetical protein